MYACQCSTKCFVKNCKTSTFHNFFILCTIFIKLSPFCSYFYSLFIEINLNFDAKDCTEYSEMIFIGGGGKISVYGLTCYDLHTAS